MTEAIKVFLVHLRRPGRNDLRDDPFYEFGSFGCTTCHWRNLMHPHHAEQLDGARLAFVQGGDLGSRLVFLTPPVKVKKWKYNCEARWTPREMPFKYKEAPVFVWNNHPTKFSLVKKFLMGVRGRTIEARLCSKIRSSATSLGSEFAQQVVEVYERERAKASRSTIASTYDQALPWMWLEPDRKRRTTRQVFIAQRQDESKAAESVLNSEGAAPKTEPQSRYGQTGRRKSSCRTR